MDKKKFEKKTYDKLHKNGVFVLRYEKGKTMEQRVHMNGYNIMLYVEG